MKTLTSKLYSVARTSATARAIRTGHTARRAKNIMVGRGIGKAGGWTRLWK